MGLVSVLVRCIWLAATRSHLLILSLVLLARRAPAQESGVPVAFALPHRWSSCAVLMLALLGAGASVVVFYRLRVRPLTRARHVGTEERWAERVRAGGELHDTLLQGCQGLMFRLQAVRELLPTDPEKAVPVLEETMRIAERAIDDARDAAIALRTPL